MAQTSHNQSMAPLAVRELRLIEALARSIVREQQVSSVMQRLAEGLVAEFGFKGAIVTQYDEEKQGFSVLGLAPPSRILLLARRALGIKVDRYVFSFGSKENKVIRTLKRGKIWIGSDFGALARPLFPGAAMRSIQRLLGIRCFYNAPLRSGSKLLGSVLVGTGAETFTAGEQALLKTVTHHAALAIHQARLMAANRKRAEQYRLLSTADSHILEEKNLQKVLKAIVSNIHIVIPCDLAGVYLYHSKQKVLVHSVASRQTAYARKLPTFDIPLSKGILGLVARSRKARIVNHAEHDPRSVYPPGKRPHLEHLICFPLIARSRLLGVMHVGRFRDDPFVESDLELAMEFATKSALAIENARFMARSLQRERELEALHRSGTKITETLDLNKVLNRILAEAMKVVTAADRGSIMLLDEAEKELFIAACVGFESVVKDNLRLPKGRGIGGYVVQTKKSIIVDDVRKNRLWIERGFKGVSPVHSIVAVPLLLKDRAIGVLNLDSTEGKTAFTHHDVVRLELFAVHAALAISNAKLLASVEREVTKIRLLRDTKNLAQNHRLKESFLNEVCRIMAEAYGYTVTSILLLDPKRRMLRLVAAAGPEASLIDSSYEQSLEEGVVGWVGRTRKRRLVQDASTDPYFISANRLSTKAELCVPILDGAGALLGVINTEIDRPFAFTGTDVEVQEAVAAEVAGWFAEQELQRALSDSERKFRRLFEESKDAIYVSTPEGRLLDVNQAAVDLFGFSSREELLTVNVGSDLYAYPADRPIVLEEIEKRGFLKDVELRLKRKNGERIAAIATITVLRDMEGQPKALQGILRDITRQKEDERRLHESEEKYRSIVEESLVGVYVIQDGKLAFVNKRFCEIFGYSQSEIIGVLKVEDLVVEEDRGIALANIRKRLTGETQSIRYKFRGKKKSGDTIEVEVYGTTSIYQGKPAIIGTLLDETQRFRQQREIAEWRQRYDLIIASSGGIVYEHDIAAHTVLWSGGIEKVLGYRLSEMRGDMQEWEEMIHPEDRKKVQEEFERAVQNFEHYDMEYRVRKKDQSYAWMRDRGFLLQDEEGKTKKILGMMEDITLQRELEERVRRSELKHRLLFEHGNDAVFVLQGELFIDCNPRALEMFECTRGDFIGQTPYAFSPPFQPDGSESKAAALEHIGRALSGRQQQFAWRHIKRDGTPFEAEVKLNGFEVEGTMLLQAQVRDITAELQAKEELARSEEKYRQLIQEAGEAILVCDGGGRIVEANEKASGMVRYSHTELLSMSIADLTPQEDEEALASYRRLYAQLLHEGQVIITEQLIARKDRTQFFAEMSSVLLGNGLFQAILRDLSEKKKAERELDQIYAIAAALHGRELFDKAAVALAELLDMQHVVVGGLSEPEDMIDTITYFRRGSLLENFSYKLANTPCGIVARTRETCIHTEHVKDLFPLDTYLTSWGIESYIGVPMFDSRRKLIGIVSLFGEEAHWFTEHEKKVVSIIAQRLSSELDIMAQRRREEQLSLQLQQSQKMESLGTLAGGVAHDFNNILGAVMGYTSLIKRDIDPQSQTGRYLDAIEKSAKRAASLSKQLLSFSHKTHGDIKVVPVNELMNDTLHILKSSFPKSIRIETSLAPTTPNVLGDQNLLGQVIMNLCINARDAILERLNGEGGVLNVSTSLVEAGSGFVDEHFSADPGQYACLTVTDNGIGMSPDLKRRIFEPFFTTKGKGKGTGLGLSMVYGIVRNHNGFIDVYSESNKGTSVKVFLPVSREEIKEQDSIQEADLPRGNGEIILVVEDEPMLRDLVADVLRGQGFQVLLASNGREAVDLFKEQSERVALVVLDMIMPEMDGPATFSALRALDPNLPVLISSGFSQDSSVQRLLNNGAAGFVAKPYQTEDLLKAIAAHVKIRHA